MPVPYCFDYSNFMECSEARYLMPPTLLFLLKINIALYFFGSLVVAYESHGGFAMSVNTVGGTLMTYLLSYELFLTCCKRIVKAIN